MFEIIRDQSDLGAPIQDVAQEAVDATTAAYAADSAIDVEAHLRAQLSSRGLAATDPATMLDLAREIRAGHEVTLGRHDGSFED